jgi:hypothetical protein
MVTRLTGQLLVNGRYSPSGRLEAEIEGLGQCGQPLAQAERLLQQRLLMAGVQTLRVGPSGNGCIVRQQVRRDRGSAARGVDEIKPDRVTQQDELGLSDDG